MRIAAIYDIHGNLPALEAVLNEIKEESVNGIVVGGDVIAGPMPSETLALLQNIDVSIYFIYGNAESELLRYIVGKKPQGLSERADERTRWVAKNLTEHQKELLANWPATCELNIEGYGNVLFCHATPNSDIKVFTRLTPEKQLLDDFEGVNTSLVICGHTHMQFDRHIGGLRVVNAGSVGMPFGQAGADWLLIDSEIEFRHTSYNISKAAKRLRESNYPYIEEFITNNVLQPPSESQALEMLTKLETTTAGKK